MPANLIASGFHTFHKVGDIFVAHVDLSPNEKREKNAIFWLDEQDLVRCARYCYDRPKREFVLCRATLRYILCSRLGFENKSLSFGTLEHGKPFGLVDGKVAPVSFNVSHSGKHGLIAIGPQGMLGVDVEERTTRVDIDSLIETVYGPNEQAEFELLGESDKRHLFFKLWTLKESLIKALGTGFTLDPVQFEIPRSIRRDEKTDYFRFPHLPNTSWKLENLENDKFAAALAYEKN